jgi:cytochrome c oxidase subunit 1
VATDVRSSLFLNPLAQGALVAMIIPGAMTFATVLNYLLGAKMTWSLSASFLIAGLVGVALGGLLGTASALPGVGNVLAGTLVVSAHVHLTTLAGTVLMLFGALYMLIPQGFGWLYSRTLGWMHLGASVTGALGFALLLNLLGFEGMPRALAAISQPPIPGPALGLFFGVTFGIGQLLFLANLLLTAYRAPRPSEAVAPTH